MTETLKCDFVDHCIQGSTKLESSDREEFIGQYRSALAESKGINGVVYVLKTESPIPRLKGSSNILYIGETKHDVWSRYYVEDDTNEFWPVYSHCISDYGPISVDVYSSSNHKMTERNFLRQYYEAHKELPPMNRKG